MLHNWFYIVPNISTGILLFFAIRKYRGKKHVIRYNCLPFLVISLYFISASLIYFVEPDVWYPYFHENSYTAINFIIYSLYLFAYLYPAIYLRPLAKTSKIPLSEVLIVLMWVMSFLGIYSFLYQLPYAIQGLEIGSADLRLQMNTKDYSLLPSNSLTTLAVGISYYYLFYIVFFFVAIINRRSLLLIIFLFIGSLSFIVSGLTFTTRDVFVFYSLSFLFCYFYFQNQLPALSANVVKLVYMLLSMILVYGIVLFSYQRFAQQNVHGGLIAGTLGYIAQQPFVFSETVEMQKDFYNGNLRFPIFKGIWGETSEVIRVHHYEWSFGTFVKDFYSTGGYPFLFGFTVLFVSIFYRKIRYARYKNIYRKLIVDIFYFHFMINGVFYFKLGDRAGNIYMITLLFFYFFSFLIPNHQRIKSISSLKSFSIIKVNQNSSEVNRA